MSRLEFLVDLLNCKEKELKTMDNYHPKNLVEANWRNRRIEDLKSEIKTLKKTIKGEIKWEEAIILLKF